MKLLHRLLATAGAAAAVCLSSGAAQATALASQTFYFFGTCDDCVLNSAPGDPIATLVLSGSYMQGSALTIEDLVSFSYVGSNLVDDYTVTQTGDDGNQFGYDMDGAMDASAGAKDFRIDFGDGLRFESTSAGNWYTCAPGNDVYYSGTCDYLNNNDFSRAGATWNGPGTPLPEPGTIALLGLAALGMARRRPAR